MSKEFSEEQEPMGSTEKRFDEINQRLDEIEHKYSELVEHAAEQGARKAISDLGLGYAEAPNDIRDLRSLLDAIRNTKRTMWQTFIRMLTTGLIIAVGTGIIMKMKLFGGE